MARAGSRGVRNGQAIVDTCVRDGLWCGACRNSVACAVPASRWSIPASAERGAKLYGSNCARCHGDDARGISPARAGHAALRGHPARPARGDCTASELGPLLRTLPEHNFKFSDKEVRRPVAVLHAELINKILRSGYNDQPTGLLSGDARAGEAYFNGAGTCNQCHSPTGNLAGVAKKYSTAALQQKFLFPGSGLRGAPRPQVTVKLRGGAYLRWRGRPPGRLQRDAAGHRTASPAPSAARAGTMVTTADPYRRAQRAARPSTPTPTSTT